ncbi:hypothetical protein MNV49_003690 [Pseudohyphozyma bogoriensis]|nr:hypothetical protein MNV49_003690 [Pseudohyphozyma bogoriensis]
MHGQFSFHIWSRSFSFTTICAATYPLTYAGITSLVPQLRNSTVFACILWGLTHFAYHHLLTAAARYLRNQFGLLKAESPRKRLTPRQVLEWKLTAALALIGRESAIFLGSSDRAEQPWLAPSWPKMPSWKGFLLIHVFIVVMDLIFYTSHRIQHNNRFLYKWVHSKHHEMHLPTTVSALYDSLFEKTFNSFLQIYLTSFLVPMPFWHMHFAAYGIFFAEILGHSGVRTHLTPPYTPILDFFDCAITIESHDLHHRFTRSNFGKQTMLFDRMFGTFMESHETNQKESASNSVEMEPATLFDGKDSKVKEVTEPPVVDDSIMVL